MPRTARLDTPGLLHHIMIRGIERRRIFNDDKDRENFIERLSILLPETKTQCYAWVFMPNHTHFLFRSGSSGISTLMRRLLTGYAVSYNRRHKRHGQLSQNRYKSIICEFGTNSGDTLLIFLFSLRPRSPENHLPPMVVRFISVSGATPSQVPLCQPPKNVSQHQSQTGKIVFIIEKRLLPPVSPLDHMVGKARCNRSGYSCHAFFKSNRFSVVNSLLWCPPNYKCRERGG